jgi:hypothetical protein
MIIVIIKPQQSADAQFTWEGADPATVRETLAKMIELLDAQFNNGAAPTPAPAKSRLIVPTPHVPPNLRSAEQP